MTLVPRASSPSIGDEISCHPKEIPPQPLVVGRQNVDLEQTQKRLLDDVVGVRGVVGHAVDVGPDRAGVPLVELAKGVFREHSLYRVVLLLIRCAPFSMPSARAMTKDTAADSNIPMPAAISRSIPQKQRVAA